MTILPTVLIVGYGFMGNVHHNNLQILQTEQQIGAITIVDIDLQRLKKVTGPCFTSLEEAYSQDRKYDIVVVVSNTQAHYAAIHEILKRSPLLPALFIEKSIVETIEQGAEIARTLKDKGYGNTKPFTGGYQFRYSPALQEALKWLEERNLRILKIRTIWQKQRLPERPSAGVHIDEATHSVDTSHYILKKRGLRDSKIALQMLERKYSDTIIDKAAQKQLYGEKLQTPLAEVRYKLDYCGIPIEGYSSFQTAPQRREIHLECDQNTTVSVFFDDAQKDHASLTVEEKTVMKKEFQKPNKVLDEWRYFLTKYRGESVPDPELIPTIEEMVFDLQITEAMDRAEIGTWVTVSR